MEPNLEELRRKKLQQLQSQLQNQAELEAQAQQQVGALEDVVKRFLDKDALMRFGTIKAADKDKATQVVMVLAQLVEAGRLRTQLTDTQFKMILEQLTPKKRDIKITRK